MENVRFVKGVTRWTALPDDGRPEVALVGRSNVGKSSLLNLLVGRRALARTSGQPGKTQELNFYLVHDRLYLVDLPGLGYAKVSRTQREAWAQLLVRYLTERVPLRLVIHLVDSRHPPTAIDEDVMELVRGGVPYAIALTKTDKLSANGRQKSVAQVKQALARHGIEAPVFPTSAEHRLGHEALWGWIEAVVGNRESGIGAPEPGNSI